MVLMAKGNITSRRAYKINKRVTQGRISDLS